MSLLLSLAAFAASHLPKTSCDLGDNVFLTSSFLVTTGASCTRFLGSVIDVGNCSMYVAAALASAAREGFWLLAKSSSFWKFSRLRNVRPVSSFCARGVNPKLCRRSGVASVIGVGLTLANTFSSSACVLACASSFCTLNDSSLRCS